VIRGEPNPGLELEQQMLHQFDCSSAEPAFDQVLLIEGVEENVQRSTAGRVANSI
jgi:hypothetical protein